MRRFVVGVMGSASDRDPHIIEIARSLGRLIAEQGWGLLSGGRDSGIMKAVNEGAKQISGSLTIGILPGSQSTPSPDVDVVIVTDMGNARNNINVLSSDIIVACGQGGAGTVSEIALALKAGKPVILLAAASLARSYFQDLGKEQVSIAESPTEAISLIKKYEPFLLASNPDIEQRPQTLGIGLRGTKSSQESKESHTYNLSLEEIEMGKGDQRSRRGKIFRGTFGKRRRKSRKQKPSARKVKQ